jgi:hypothetical protein
MTKGEKMHGYYGKGNMQLCQKKFTRRMNKTEKTPEIFFPEQA